MCAFKYYIVLALFVLAGCLTPPTAEEAARLNIFMTRWVDVRERRHTPRTTFTRNDVPTALIENLGWKTQMVTVEFLNRDTGQVVFRATGTLPRNERQFAGPTAAIPAGNYSLKVTPQNSAPLTQNFTVYGN